MPAQANATVTAVAGQGAPEDWDTAAQAGPAKWAGEVRAYYRESLVEQRGEGTVTVVKRRELVIDNDDVDLLELDTNDVITFLVDGAPAPSSASAAVIPRRRLAGVPRHLQTSRIVLEDAAA